MVFFGRWPLWAVVAAVVALSTFAIADAMVRAGNLVLAAALVAVVVIGAIYWLRGSLNHRSRP